MVLVGGADGEGTGTEVEGGRTSPDNCTETAELCLTIHLYNFALFFLIRNKASF